MNTPFFSCNAMISFSPEPRLKKYVDAWRPLFQTLDDGQKVRLRFAAAYLMHELRDAVANRLSQYADDDESDW